MLNLELIPSKLLDVCDFVKTEKGCVMYSSYTKPELRKTLLIKATLEDFEIPHSFRVASKSLEIAKKLENAEIKVTESSFVVKNDKSKFTSKLLVNETFDPNEDVEFTSSQAMNVKKMLNACDYVAKIDKKPVLKGVYLTTNGNIYSTDSFSLYQFYNSDNTNDETGIIIPTDFIKTVNSLFGTEDITIKFNDKKVVAEKDNITIESILYSGVYPNVKQIINACMNNYVFNINTKIFDEVVEYIGFIDYSVDKKPLVKLEKNLISLIGENEFTSEISFDIDWSMNVDSSKFANALKTASGEDVRVCALRKDNQGQMIMLVNNETNERVLVLGIVKEN